MLFFFNCFFAKAQVYDVLVTEDFSTTTNLVSDGAFRNDNEGCGFADNFDVSSNYGDPTNATGYVTQEVGSIFYAADIDGTGGATPTYLDVFSYTVTDNDEIGFVGNFANPSCSNALDIGADKLEVKYSTDSGATFLTALTITATSSSRLSCSDGTIHLSSVFRTKEFVIGDNLNGQTIVIRVQISGFQRGDEHFALDEFRLVKTKELLASENFDNTTSLTTSSGASTYYYNRPFGSGCDDNDVYNISANIPTPSDLTDCTNYEEGSIFVLNHRLVTPAADGEELIMLSYTAATNNEISFRGNFTTFGSGTDSDNNVVVQYSTDNGASYTTGFTFTGTSTVYNVSDGTVNLPYQDFITKGFSIGTGLSGQVISIKVIFNVLDNDNDGIALDKFMLEGSSVIFLPIELLDFTPRLNGDEVYVDWRTTSEVNNDYFTVQRSLNGSSFEDIGIVGGAGNSNDVLNYNYIDDGSELSGIVYYRLKQTDYDGKTSYSRVKPVDLSGLIQNTWNVYPNPAKDRLVINGDVSKVELRNVLGELIGLDVSNASALNLSSVTNGTYFVKVWFNDGRSDVKRIVVNH